MLNNISWQGYWTCIALASGGYYLTIYLLYYHRDFKAWLLQKVNRAPQRVASNSVPFFQNDGDTSKEAIQQTSLFDNESSSEFQLPPVESEEAVANACVDELNAYLEEAKRSKCVKPEMIYALGRLLRKYPSLKNSEYKDSLSKVIVAQCEHLCSIHLSADEVMRVWTGVDE